MIFRQRKTVREYSSFIDNDNNNNNNKKVHQNPLHKKI